MNNPQTMRMLLAEATRNGAKTYLVYDSKDYLTDLYIAEQNTGNGEACQHQILVNDSKGNVIKTKWVTALWQSSWDV